jgi:hypothetical protein
VRRRHELRQQHAIVGGPQEVIDTYGRLVEAGVDTIIVSCLPGLARGQVLEALASDVGGARC